MSVSIVAGLFNRILTKTARWSQEIGGQNPYCMYRRVARFFLDAEHDFVLERSAMKYSRLKVSKAFRWEDRIPTVCTGV